MSKPRSEKTLTQHRREVKALTIDRQQWVIRARKAERALVHERARCDDLIKALAMADHYRRLTSEWRGAPTVLEVEKA